MRKFVLSLFLSSSVASPAGHGDQFIGRLEFSRGRTVTFHPAETIPEQLLPLGLDMPSNPVDLSAFGKAMLRPLEGFAGVIGEFMFDRKRVLEVRYSSQVKGEYREALFYADHASLTGPLIMRDGSHFIGLPHLAMKVMGAVTRSRDFVRFTGMSKVHMLGTFDPDEDAFRVSMISAYNLRHVTDVHLVIEGILHQQNGRYFVEVPGHIRYPINENSIATNVLKANLGEAVLVSGKNPRNLMVESLLSLERTPETGCAGDLLSRFLAGK